MADIFSDALPESIPKFDDENFGINSNLGNPPIASPGDAFSYFFDGIVIDALCEWANERTAEFFWKNPGKKMK